MAINWFTFLAQIINFFVLIFLLKRFLYKPIIQAMESREKAIDDRFLSASQQQKAAEDEMQHYQEMQQQFTDQKNELLIQSKSEVEQTHQNLLTEMYDSVAKDRSQWQTTLQGQKKAFLDEVSRRTIDQLQATVRRVLTDLAESELEAQTARVFLQRLQNLNETERSDLTQVLTTATKDSIPLTLVSAFALPQAISESISQVLQDYFKAVGSAKIELTCEIKSSLICGIELRGTGYKLAWSMDAYLDTLTENLVAVFAEESGH